MSKNTPREELQIIIAEQELEPSKVEGLLEKFTDYLGKAKTIAAQGKHIVVTSEGQKSEMQEAKKLRIELRDIRIAADKTRKDLKEQSLREGRAIDGVYNIIKALIVPVEEHLEKQEKFIEEIEKKRAEEKHQKRVQELSPFVNDISVYDLKNMSEETFQELLGNSKKAKEDQAKAEKQAEELRITQEKKDAAEKEASRLQREKLEKENEEKQKALDEQKKKNEELEAKIAADKKEREEKEEADRARKMAILRAPDKEKLIALAKVFEEIELPNVVSPEAQKTVEDIKGLQIKVVMFIHARAENL
jgi:hypothetical protein